MHYTGYQLLAYPTTGVDLIPVLLRAIGGHCSALANQPLVFCSRLAMASASVARDRVRAV
jgi:hypothetical protein